MKVVRESSGPRGSVGAIWLSNLSLSFGSETIEYASDSQILSQIQYRTTISCTTCQDLPILYGIRDDNNVNTKSIQNHSLLRNQYNNVIFSILYQIMYLRSLAGLYYLSSAQPKRSQNEKCYAGQIRPQKIECEAKIIKRSQSSSTSKLRKNWGQSPKFRFELLIGSRTANVAFKRSQNGS